MMGGGGHNVRIHTAECCTVCYSLIMLYVHRYIHLHLHHKLDVHEATRINSRAGGSLNEDTAILASALIQAFPWSGPPLVRHVR